MALCKPRPALAPFLRTHHCTRRVIQRRSSTSPFSFPPTAAARPILPQAAQPDEPIERPPTNPWFLRGPAPAPSHPFSLPQPPPPALSPPPPTAPPYVHTIHAHLALLPQIDPSTIYCGPPLYRAYDMHLEREREWELRRLKGRRGRGSRYDQAGEGVPEGGVGEGAGTGAWRWVVVGQVREGTEGRGAVEGVMKSVRGELRKSHPLLPLPPKARKKTLAPDGWGMLDLGETAVHVVSRSARLKWFSDEDVNKEEERVREIYGGWPSWAGRMYTE